VAARYVLAGAIALVGAAGTGVAEACADREGSVPHIRVEGTSFAANDRVVIAKDRAGTFKVADTGHANDVVAEPGRTGVFIAGVPREEGAPVAIACVLFDAQSWFDAEVGATVELPPFEATIHGSYLRVER
jgi:hypothetical protein